MSLNDEAERLSTAHEFLLSYEADTQEFDAALEHVVWVHKNRPEYKKRCADILIDVIQRRSDPETIEKIQRIAP